jgi:galactokinase
MDQFASAASRVGRALLLDCRSLQVQAVPLPAHVAVVVMDTGVRRSLAASAYNDRRASCERAVERLREVWPDVRALRDVTPDMLQAERGRLDERTWKRAAHVVAENVRPLGAADALRRADLATAGALMNDSHASLRDLYEVSCEELDYMVERAVEQPGCHGARMTGAGFGGCAVALVDSAAGDAFARAVESAYRARYDLPAHCFACRPAEGAHLL